MKNRYLIYICLITIFLMSISSVSAIEDANINDLGISSDSNFEDTPEMFDATKSEMNTKENGKLSENLEPNSNILAISNEDIVVGNIISVENFTFAAIQTAVDNASDGDAVFIKAGTYLNNGNGPIRIGKSISIFGEQNLTILDAQKTSFIFDIYSKSINIRDIIFMNGASYYGGAIVFNNNIYNSNINATYINNYAEMGGANLFNSTVSNSNVSGTYIGNYAYGGGANFFYKGGSNLNVTGTYINNTAFNGGANFFQYELSNTIVSGTYIDNTVNNDGGANLFYEMILTNSNVSGTYIDNTGTHGGANHFTKDVSNSTIIGTYINNTAYYDGGANFFLNTVLNSNVGGTYIDNTAYYGGANYFYRDTLNSTVNGTYTGNTATNEKYDSAGGANYFRMMVSNSTIIGTYTNNSAYYGGANHFESEISNSNITGIYIDNTAYVSGGANIFNNVARDVDIIGNYINNSGIKGAASYFNMEIKNVSIVGNYINNQGNNTIYIKKSNSNNIIHDSIFIDNSGTDILVDSNNISIENTWFGNNATNYNEKPLATNANMTNWLFLNATADPDCVMLNKNSTVTFKLCLYNETSKEISAYDSSEMDVILELTQTLGELNQTTASISEKITYTFKQSGNATITGKFKSAYYTLSIISMPTVNGTDIVKMYKNDTQYYATFRDNEGKYLANGTYVIFIINNITYERKVSGDEGLAKLNINLNQGEYIITVINSITGDKTTNIITVLSLISENKNIIKYYRNATQYTVKVLSGDGKAVGKGITVTFNINGVFYERQTNESGIAKLNINLNPGSYIITAEYNGCRISNIIVVLPILNAADISMKYRDGTRFKVKLVDGQGKPYANQHIQFNINGVFYNRVTDSNGQAKLNINLMPGEYIITSSYNDSFISNKITIKS